MVRSLIAFVLLGVVALALVAVAGVVVIRRLATDQALAEARQLTEVTSRVVQRRVNDRLLTGDAESLAAVTEVAWPPPRDHTCECREVDGVATHGVDQGIDPIGIAFVDRGNDITGVVDRLVRSQIAHEPFVPRAHRRDHVGAA